MTAPTTQALRDALALAKVMFGANDPATRCIAAALKEKKNVVPQS